MKNFLLISLFCLSGASLPAQLWLPSIFGNHMVLQREREIPVWGRTDPGATVRILLDGEETRVLADHEGKWKAFLAERKAGGPFTMRIESGDEVVELEDILVGEVWVCSGQSNMQWAVANANYAGLEKVTAQFPEIRLLTIPRLGTQVSRKDFDGRWERCSPLTVSDFSAVGYFFGRRIHHALGVPVGLIDNAWGGSSAEAWIPREVMESYPVFAATLEDWDQRLEAFTDAHLARLLAEYEAEREAWEDGDQKERAPRKPKDIRIGQHRPGNLYHGMMAPILGYGIRGMIWYQGESNAGRAEEYRDLFPLMIETLRESWEQGDFPFYWVQLADFKDESDGTGDSGWAMLREAQTMTMERVPAGGQAVIIDLGEGRDIHPRNKQEVANRLALWALAKDYGYPLTYRSPQYASMEPIGEGKVRIHFDYVSDEGLYAFDTRDVRGFAIAGEDMKFVPAEAEIVDTNAVEVWSSSVANPAAVRYGWATNPVVNLYDRKGLPVTPFRTDGGTAPASPEEDE